MPSVVFQTNVGTQTIVAEKLTAKIKPKAIFVDNVAGAADADLVFNDVFTPSVTNAVPIPVLTTTPRLHINVAAGTSVSTEEPQLKDIDFIGLVQMVVNAGAALANCFVTFIYSLE